MKKRKYEAKTGEEWLQHASVYLHREYYRDGEWINDNAKQAQRVIRSLIRYIGDNNG